MRCHLWCMPVPVWQRVVEEQVRERESERDPSPHGQNALLALLLWKAAGYRKETMYGMY